MQKIKLNSELLETLYDFNCNKAAAQTVLEAKVENKTKTKRKPRGKKAAPRAGMRPYSNVSHPISLFGHLNVPEELDERLTQELYEDFLYRPLIDRFKVVEINGKEVAVTQVNTRGWYVISRADDEDLNLTVYSTKENSTEKLDLLVRLKESQSKHVELNTWEERQNFRSHHFVYSYDYWGGVPVNALINRIFNRTNPSRWWPQSFQDKRELAVKVSHWVNKPVAEAVNKLEGELSVRTLLERYLNGNGVNFSYDCCLHYYGQELLIKRFRSILPAELRTSSCQRLLVRKFAAVVSPSKRHEPRPSSYSKHPVVDFFDEFAQLIRTTYLFKDNPNYVYEIVENFVETGVALRESGLKEEYWSHYFTDATRFKLLMEVNNEDRQSKTWLVDSNRILVNIVCSLGIDYNEVIEKVGRPKRARLEEIHDHLTRQFYKIVVGTAKEPLETPLIPKPVKHPSGWMFFQPETKEVVYYWGCLAHNCVGSAGYANRVAEKKILLVFGHRGTEKVTMELVVQGQELLFKQVQTYGTNVTKDELSQMVAEIVTGSCEYQVDAEAVAA